MTIQDDMNLLILNKLKEIEKEYDITVLWAVESGSRAWGFESEDSDYDVRFIYKRKMYDYLKLEQTRDVLEIQIDDTLDIVGWDLDKALKLLYRSNPSLLEWLNSPIIYLESDFDYRIKELVASYYQEDRLLYHYLNMCKSTIKKYFQSEKVLAKKYFYAIRPILACLWIMDNHQTPPVLFKTLCDSVLPSELLPSINKLLMIKRTKDESYAINHIEVVDSFLEGTIKDVERYLSTSEFTNDLDWNLLNTFFINEVSKINK